MSLEPIKLRYNDGRFVMVFEEDLPLAKHRLVHSYLQEFSRSLKNKKVYPINPHGIAIIEENRWLINFIGNIINSEILWDEVLTEDLYSFFVVNFDEEGNQLNCRLGNLLGFVEPTKSQESAEIPETSNENSKVADLSTGDILLDVEAMTLMTFKRGAELIQTHSLAQLVAMNKFAGDCMERARKEAEKEAKDQAEDKTGKVDTKIDTKVEPAPPLPQASAEFRQNKEAIANNLIKMGVAVPKGF